MPVEMIIADGEPIEEEGFIHISRYPYGTGCDNVLGDVISVCLILATMEYDVNLENATINPVTLEIQAERILSPLTRLESLTRKKEILDSSYRVLFNAVIMRIFFDMDEASRLLSMVHTNDRDRGIDLVEFLEKESNQLRRTNERREAVDTWINQATRSYKCNPASCQGCIYERSQCKTVS